MIRDEDLKAFRKVTDWLESDPEGQLWRQTSMHPTTYGREAGSNSSTHPYGTFGFFSLKHTDTDASGGEYDFTCVLWWGRLPGDGELLEMLYSGTYPEPLIR